MGEMGRGRGSRGRWLPPAEARLRLRRRGAVPLAFVPLGLILAARIEGILRDSVLAAYGATLVSLTAIAVYLAFVHYRDPSDAPPVLRGPLVSCLVAVKNEEAMIGACIRSILRSTYRRLELIVIDDGSRDGTLERLHQLQSSLRFEIVSLPQSVGKKRALASGAARAEGELFVFTDSDTIIAEDAIERLVRAFAAHPEIGAASGHARALNGGANVLTKMQDSWYEGQFSIWKAAESVFGAVSCVSGPLAAYRRAAIYNFFPAWANDTFLGGEFRFATDRQLTGYVLGNEELASSMKLRYLDSSFVFGESYVQRRWRVAYVKSARAWTFVPSSVGGFVRQQVRWKKSFIRNLFFTGRFYWRRGPVPAVLFYVHALIVVVAPVMAFRHLIYLPMRGELALVVFYLASILLKGMVWALVYKVECPGCRRWIYRPLMSVVTLVLSSGLLIYAALTLRRSVWARESLASRPSHPEPALWLSQPRSAWQRPSRASARCAPRPRSQLPPARSRRR